jgi:hypothetical protein
MYIYVLLFVIILILFLLILLYYINSLKCLKREKYENEIFDIKVDLPNSLIEVVNGKKYLLNFNDGMKLSQENKSNIHIIKNSIDVDETQEMRGRMTACLKLLYNELENIYIIVSDETNIDMLPFSDVYLGYILKNTPNDWKIAYICKTREESRPNDLGKGLYSSSFMITKDDMIKLIPNISGNNKNFKLYIFPDRNNIVREDNKLVIDKNLVNYYLYPVTKDINFSGYLQNTFAQVC